MGKLLVGLLFLGSFSSYAVRTQFCPPSFKLEIVDFETYSSSSIYNYAQQLNLHYTDYTSIGYILDHGLFTIDWILKLSSTESSQCSYSAVSNFSDDLSYEGISSYKVVIMGTDKNPVLRITIALKGEFVHLYLLSRYVTAKRPYYNFSGSNILVSVRGHRRSWGVSEVEHIHVGTGRIL